MTEVAPKSSNDLAVERTDLAAERTMMAADRTLMAWIRTSLSLMSFGFTIYKLLQGFQAGGAALPHSDSPRSSWARSSMRACCVASASITPSDCGDRRS